MKKLYSILLAGSITCILFSCKKNSGDKSDNNNLLGYWELAETSSAMMPARQYAPGNGNIIELTASSYKRYENGQLIASGAYTTMPDNSVQKNVCLVFEDDRFTRRIIFDTAQAAPKTFYEIRDDKLAFISGCYANDAGHKKEYRRTNKNLIID
jgi:hypothetical protein